MLGHPKKTLGLTIAALAFLLVVIAISPKKSLLSTFKITARQNRFYIGFDIAKKDSAGFQKLLEKLNAPASISKGIEFELDGTPSAILNFALPIEGTLNPSPSSLIVSGNLMRSPTAETYTFQSFSFPQDLNFALSHANLQDTAKIYLSLLPDIAESVAQDSAIGPQYLAAFGNSSVYIFKTGTFDIASLKNQKEYKEETVDNIKVYLLTKVSIFEIGEWTYITSTLDAAKSVINTQKDPKNSIDFPSIEKGNFALLFTSSEKNPAPESLLVKIFNSKDKIPNFMSKISKIEFTLKDTAFSALIELK